MNTSEAINVTVRLAQIAMRNYDFKEAYTLLNSAIFLMLDSETVEAEVKRKMEEYGYK